MELTLKQKTAFGIGAVGKDMVYALSASYVMYYYQDVLGLSASFVGVVLMAARFFDAFNDPFMGVLVAKTRTRWGRFRPWIFSGTLAQCAGALRPVCRPGAGRSGVDGLLQRGVHPVGRHLYHDGYPILVHDPRRDSYPKRPGEPFHGGAYLCGRWLCPHRHVHHAAGGSPWRRQRARWLPLGGIDRSGNFCSDRAGVLHFHERNHPQ